MTNTLITILAAFFVFGLLIIGHELGHFTMAKIARVPVLEFAFGMGPRLFGFTKGETKYSIRLFPIGGYVKMLGEDDESSDPKAFCNQSPWKKLSIIIAGPFMNFVLAVMLFFFYCLNMGIIKPVIGSLVQDYPAQAAGLQVGDKVIYADDTKINEYEDLSSFIDKNGEKQITLTVVRNGETLKLNVQPVYDKEQERFMIGITYGYEKGDVLGSLKNGVMYTGTSIKELVVYLAGAFRGNISIKDVGGPVAIVKMSGEAAQSGIWTLLFFAGFLSINLGVMNLIPFPALDGGWVIILLIEAIRGKKMDDNKVGIINLIGFSILMAFVILVTYKDIFIR
jgi:regulator of sigma E protease